MNALRPELAAALSRLYPGSRDETLTGDASNRRFHRLFLAGGGTRIVMDYGASFDRETDDVRLARVFDEAGVRVARVIDVLPEAGALVEEDLGDETLETALARAASGGAPGRDELYRSAMALAADIASKGTASLARSDRAAGPALDDERFRFEMNFFLEHYVGTFLGRPEIGSTVRPALESLASDVASHPRVLCHRDYHCRNIMVCADGSLALVDIQDARWGPDTYDLASLLRDAYVDLADAEVDALFEAYSKRFAGAEDGGARRARFEMVSAQRMIKALGTFGYQVAVLGRDRYRSAIPRTVNRLARLLPKRTITASLADTLGAAGLMSA